MKTEFISCASTSPSLEGKILILVMLLSFFPSYTQSADPFAGLRIIACSPLRALGTSVSLRYVQSIIEAVQIECLPMYNGQYHIEMRHYHSKLRLLLCKVDLLINTWKLPTAGHLLDANLLPCFGGPAYDFDSQASTELQVWREH